MNCRVQSFFENLNPMENHKGEREFIDYLFEKSLQIEPRRSLPAKFVSDCRRDASVYKQ